MKAKKSSELMNYAGTFGALIILCVVLSFASDNFLKISNLMTILKQAPFYAMLASGMLFCLITAGIVSIGRSGICNGVNAIQPYDTDAIACCIIGGASFNGGKGTMLGTMLGALISPPCETALRCCLFLLRCRTWSWAS